MKEFELKNDTKLRLYVYLISQIQNVPNGLVGTTFSIIVGLFKEKET